MSSINPSMIKNILKKNSGTAAPGEDGIIYGVLAKMPSTQYFLATLYNKLDKSSIAPNNWTMSIVVLAYKDGNTDDASNFRMIALTSCLAKGRFKKKLNYFHGIFHGRGGYPPSVKIINFWKKI